MMKLFKIFTILFMGTLLLTSCNSDDMDEEQGSEDSTSTNTFSRLGILHTTPNAYLVYSPVLQYDQETGMDVIKYADRVRLVFTNGAATINAEGERVYSASTEHLVSLSLRDVTDGQVKDMINDIQFGAGEYTISPGSTVVVDGNVDINYSENNIDYGELNGYYLPLTNEDTAEISITSLDIDYESGQGYIQADYSISPGIDGQVAGNYSGSFTILKK